MKYQSLRPILTAFCIVELNFLFLQNFLELCQAKKKKKGNLILGFGVLCNKAIKQPWIWESIHNDVLLKGIGIERHQGCFTLMRNLRLPVNYFIKLCILKQLIILRKHYHKQHILRVASVSSKKINIRPITSEKNTVSEREMKGFFWLDILQWNYLLYCGMILNSVC